MGDVIILADVIAARMKREQAKKQFELVSSHSSIELIPQAEFPDYIGAHYHQCAIDQEVERFRNSMDRDYLS
jgi:hypothetical protein